jgi:N-acetyl-gamma-glutamyl-phosphate/LysW-gamma-L-alpha-aminoadipyl-6-phosphate reductase
VKVAVVGATGYIGGELVRLLLGHPRVELVAATSRRLAGRRVDGAHPNLRGATDLRFIAPDSVPPVDALFLALPHATAMVQLDRYTALAKLVIDLSADFRLQDPAPFERHFGTTHTRPAALSTFTYGLPERHRSRIATADRIAVPGCMATAAILALHPLAVNDLLDRTHEVSVDARTGSSGSGASAGPGNLHAERSGAMRVFAPTGHRHEAEIEQETGLTVTMSATGVEAVRGVQVLGRARLSRPMDDADLRAVYRSCYADEPFVRVVAQHRGAFRLPEPKILLGSNFCDVGFVPRGRSVVVVAALDNLVKGGAGTAVQCLNIRHGWPERTGLEFTGLHPI